ncbi:MAG: MotE family protein [Roseinatronobacter sp.]
MSRKSSARPATVGLLLLLAGLFLAAGMSRLGLGVVEVLAAETSSEDSAPQTAEAPDPADLFQSLRAREARLAKAEAELEERRAMLRETEAALERQLADLLAAETRLSDTLRLTETAAEDDLRQLTAVFENMKPQQAAGLFATMNVEFAAGFMARLRPETAAEIMAGLDPLIGYAISAVLAGRHASTPRN